MNRMTFRLCVREYYDYRSCQRVQHITLDRALGTRRSMHDGMDVRPGRCLATVHLACIRFHENSIDADAAHRMTVS